MTFKAGTAFPGPRSRQQRGMTTLGMIILVAFIGMFVFAGLRLTPVYLNYFNVNGVLNGVQQEFDGQSPTRTAIRSSISRRFDIEDVKVIRPQQIEIKSVSNGFEVSVNYKHESPYIGNLGFIVTFDKKVLVRR